MQPKQPDKSYTIEYLLLALVLGCGALLIALALCDTAVFAQAPPAPPSVRYEPAPDGWGIRVEVESQAPEAHLIQRRGTNEWTLEDRIIQNWQAGDQLIVLEVERDAVGVVWQRRTGVDPPVFVVALPVIVRE